MKADKDNVLSKFSEKLAKFKMFIKNFQRISNDYSRNDEIFSSNSPN